MIKTKPEGLIKLNRHFFERLEFFLVFAKKSGMFFQKPTSMQSTFQLTGIDLCRAEHHKNVNGIQENHEYQLVEDLFV